MDNVKMVECRNEYWEFVRTLRMDPRVADGFVVKAVISNDQQIEYMSKYAGNYWICLYEGRPAGYVGEVDNDIRICTHPDYQGQGIAKIMVQHLLKIKPQVTCRIKHGNIESQKLFESLGFKPKMTYYTRDNF